MPGYFPQGIAMDEAFCNREQERAALRKSIMGHEHIVLVAPRRYGKTSLMTKVLTENSFPSASIDFFFVLTQTEVTKLISEGISQIMTSLLPKTKAACHAFIEAIAVVNPKLSLNFLGQKLEISTKQTTEKSISELLLALDQFAEKAKKTCVLVLDEFQQIGELKENHAIEAAIRHAVERSQWVSYIFCGSKRHLLNEMFTDKSRPLYHLCDLMTIERIHSASYDDFLNHLARETWRQPLTKEVLEEILHLTENHPYYVNALCRRLWRLENLPTFKDVTHLWDHYVNQQATWIIDDLSKLTLNRRKVITALAYQPTDVPQGQNFCMSIGLSPSAIKKCLDDLQNLDMVYRDKNAYYRVLDPVVAYFIRKNGVK